jgi:hypothetical protein
VPTRRVNHGAPVGWSKIELPCKWVHFCISEDWESCESSGRVLVVYVRATSRPLCKAFVVNFTTPCREIQDSWCFVMVYTMNFNIHFMMVNLPFFGRFFGLEIQIVSSWKYVMKMHSRERTSNRTCPNEWCHYSTGSESSEPTPLYRLHHALWLQPPSTPALHGLHLCWGPPYSPRRRHHRFSNAVNHWQVLVTLLRLTWWGRLLAVHANTINSMLAH